MSQIPRPPKQGNVMTYVAKVAAGYPHILAGEMDADLDTIYGAWNTGVDTVNIRDGAVTSAKLAADSVGPRELADAAVAPNHLAPAAVTTPALADASVTDPKIVSVAWSKVTGVTLPTALPPSGAAGGDLAGTYPNPTIRPGAVSGAALATGSVGAAQIADGSVGTVRLLVDGAVTRAKLAPSALLGNISYVAVTFSSTTTIGAWVPVATLPPLTTRGANPVMLFANHGLGVAVASAPGTVLIRWQRDGAHICNTTWGAGGATVAPLPSLPWMDVVPAAGTYVYTLEVQLGAGVSNVYTALNTGCSLLARELG